MKITIHTSKQGVFNILENQILKLISNKSNDGKYIYYTSKSDFIEHLYDLASIVSNTETTLDLNPDNDWNYKTSSKENVAIIQGRFPKHEKSFEVESNGFTYL